MRALPVVFISPAGDLASPIPEIPEPTRIETFVPKAPMKALDMPVLCGLAGLNVNRADAALNAPRQVMPAAYLRPVIGTNEFRCAALADGALQHPRQALARHACIRLQCQTFARKGIHPAEHA